MEKSNFKKLIVELIENSIADNWSEASLEWEFSRSIQNTKGNCLCGHKLHNLYYIVNINNNKELIVGSSCVKKFENNTLKQAIDTIERDELRKRKEAKIAKANIDKYEKLKSSQIEVGTPPSIRKEFLLKRFTSNVISEFEYNFYMNIWNFVELSNKQLLLKQKINTKLLATV